MSEHQVSRHEKIRMHAFELASARFVGASMAAVMREAEALEVWIKAADMDARARARDAEELNEKHKRAERPSTGAVIGEGRGVVAAVTFPPLRTGYGRLDDRAADESEVVARELPFSPLQCAWLEEFIGNAKGRSVRWLIGAYYAKVCADLGVAELPTMHMASTCPDSLALDEDRVVHRWQTGRGWVEVDEFPGFRLGKLADGCPLLWAPGTWPPSDAKPGDMAKAAAEHFAVVPAEGDIASGD